ncbi:MAG: hypothetical protein PVI33_01555 [Candidatus Omnitrophota bacterium]|jgi:hypothetical protein
MLTKQQWSYIKFWLVVVIIAEVIMFLLNEYLVMLYLVIAVFFLCGFILRILNLYPGKKEPHLLDSSAVVIALLFAYVSAMLKISNMRFLLILTSSIIILPHLKYIISNENI